MTEPREQFTFYRSFYDGIRRLSKRDQSAIILAICSYALYEEEPEKLSPSAATAFDLIRPVLDSGRKKAANGKQGGSKPKAPTKQTANKKEREKEREREKEKEIDRSKWEADLFGQLWNTYPAWRRGNRDEAIEVYRLKVRSEQDAHRCLAALREWKRSDQWEKDAGQYTPALKKWLEQGLWMVDPPPKSGPIWGASGILGEAEMEAIRRVLSEDIDDACNGQEDQG